MGSRQCMYLIFGLCFFGIILYFSSIEHRIKSNVNNALKAKINRPNFIFILTDDQDSVMGSMKVMKNVKKLLINEGTSFSNSFAAAPLCCPSRASILTGQYVHNHKTINNSLSGGCSSLSWQRGPEKHSFATVFKKNNYRTFFAGKYLNKYGFKDVGGLSHIPPGWDWWIGLQGNSKYYNYKLSVNGSEETHTNNSKTDYLTNVIRSKGLEFLNSFSNDPTTNDPFFMMLSTPACHAPFEAEPKYLKKFPHEKVPRTPNFNIPNDQSKHWLMRLGEQPLSNQHIEQVDEIYRKRLQTLLSVDDLVGDIYLLLRKKNLLQNTYIIFTSDHGYHLGQFSLPLDKREPYESDIRVPLVITGPGIPHSVLDIPTTNIDLAPTFLSLAGINVPKNYDGISLKPFLMQNSEISKNSIHYSDKSLSYKSRYGYFSRRTLLVEHSGEYLPVNRGCESLGPNLHGCTPLIGCKCEDSKNNTYACLRHLNKDSDFTYCSWQDNDNFEEFYNLKQDQYQLNNSINYLSISTLKKLRSLLRNYKKCHSARCRKLSKFVL